MSKKKSKREPEYIRKGKCKQCGLCCLFKDGMKQMRLNSNEYKFNKALGYTEVGRSKIKPKKGRPWTRVIMGKLQGCPHLTMDKGKFKCKLHGTNRQPQVCRVYPQHPNQDYYKCFKEVCGYRFIKNPKYKPPKKPKAKKIIVKT